MMEFQWHEVTKGDDQDREELCHLEKVKSLVALYFNSTPARFCGSWTA